MRLIVETGRVVGTTNIEAGVYPVYPDVYQFRIHPQIYSYYIFRSIKELGTNVRFELDDMEIHEARRNREVLCGTWMFNPLLDRAFDLYWETHRDHQTVALLPFLPAELVSCVYSYM